LCTTENLKELHEQILLLQILIKDNIDRTITCLVATSSTFASLALVLPFTGFSFPSALKHTHTHGHACTDTQNGAEVKHVYSFPYGS
jgi:hypothetical protein